ncbi:hypothetical protein GCM10009849_14890 [Sinomonas flava]|uniref:Uncharacterized protein n=1 Tax=Sinomonas flava TaxID=496857 RepID=A0ABN3BQM5_9MICC
MKETNAAATTPTIPPARRKGTYFGARRTLIWRWVGMGQAYRAPAGALSRRQGPRNGWDGTPQRVGRDPAMHCSPEVGP